MRPPELAPLVSAWRDSRRASARLYRDVGRSPLLRLAGLVAVAFLCYAAWRWLTGSLDPPQRLVLLLFVGAIGLWVTEAIPPFAVGLLVIGYLVFVLGTDLILPEPWDVAPYVNTWSSSVIWLMLGGFFLAEGLSRTGLDRLLFERAIRPARGEPRRVLFAVMATTALASMVMSNTATTALMIGAVSPLVGRKDVDRNFVTALLLGIPLAASVGGMGTIIGSPPNAIAVGVAESAGYSIDFLQWMLYGLPAAVVLVVLGWLLLCRRYPVAAERVDLDLSGGDPPALPALRDRLIVAGVTATTVGLWLTTPLHDIPTAIVSIFPIVALSVTQIVQVAQVRALPWDTLMLVSGGLSLGAAIVDVHLVDVFVGHLGLLRDLPSGLVVFAVLGLVTVLLSNFMSNTAAVSVLLPVAIALVPGREVSACVILGLSASCALFLPVSTPPNAIAFSTGGVQARDFRPGGLIIGLVGPLLVIGWVLVAQHLVR